MTIILFDIDGTLIRAGGAGRKALNLAAFRMFGRRNACSLISLQGRTDLWNFRQAIRNCTGRAPRPGEVERLMKAYLKLLPGFVRRAVARGEYILPPGIKRLVRRLSREDGVILGLGTGNLEKGARIKLEPSGFNRHFPFGGFGSDSLSRASLLKKAVKRARPLTNGAAPMVFVVGDTALDVKAGRKAGYRTVGVGTGFAAWEDLAASKPDHLARDFRDTEKWLKWFGIKD